MFSASGPASGQSLHAVFICSNTKSVFSFPTNSINLDLISAESPCTLMSVIIDANSCSNSGVISTCPFTDEATCDAISPSDFVCKAFPTISWKVSCIIGNIAPVTSSGEVNLC